MFHLPKFFNPRSHNKANPLPPVEHYLEIYGTYRGLPTHTCTISHSVKNQARYRQVQQALTELRYKKQLNALVLN